MYLTHKDIFVTDQSQAKELPPFGFQNWIWWGARQTNLAGSPCGASGARPGHCWQVSQHWPGVMLECGRETICLHPSPAWHCHSSACMIQQPGSETATCSSCDCISLSRQSNSSWNWFGPISILHDSLANQTKWLHWKQFMFPHQNQIGASKQFIESNSTNQTWVL